MRACACKSVRAHIRRPARGYPRVSAACSTVGATDSEKETPRLVRCIPDSTTKLAESGKKREIISGGVNEIPNERRGTPGRRLWTANQTSSTQAPAPLSSLSSSLLVAQATLRYLLVPPFSLSCSVSFSYPPHRYLYFFPFLLQFFLLFLFVSFFFFFFNFLHFFATSPPTFTFILFFLSLCRRAICTFL